MTKSGQNVAITYLYDGDGKRLAKIVNGAATRYVYDGSTVVEELNGANQNQLYRLAGIGYIQGGVQYYNQEDAQGSSLRSMDGSGAVMASNKYDAFGANMGPGPSDSSYRWVGAKGYLSDAESGMDWLGSRFYLPVLGRFLTADPIGHGGGLNLYEYCDDNPLTRFDPSGHDWKDAVSALSSNRDLVLKLSKGWQVPPELVGGILFVECYANGKPLMHDLNEGASMAKFLWGQKASLGVMQLQYDPAAIDALGYNTYDWLSHFELSPFIQINDGAFHVLELASRPNRFRGRTSRLTDREMAILATEWNIGPKSSPLSKAKIGAEGRQFLKFLPTVRNILAGH